MSRRKNSHQERKTATKGKGKKILGGRKRKCIILAVPSESIDDILDVFNSLYTKLQFTTQLALMEK